MSTYDGRKIDYKIREAIRIRAVQRIFDGESPEVIAKTLGYHRSAVYQWLNRYDAEGVDGLKCHKIPGKKPALSKVQLQKIFDIITSKNPLQLKFPFALWTRRMVKNLILDQFGIELTEVSVGRLLRQTGLMPQRPPECVNRFETLRNVSIGLRHFDKKFRLQQEALRPPPTPAVGG